MTKRAILIAGLLTTGAAAAMQTEATATEPGSTGQPFAAHGGWNGSSGGAGVARWDGKVVDPGAEIRGLHEDAREAIETWRRFAVNRGYRIDLDETQRVMLVSDADRFSHFTASATVVERALEALEPFSSPSDAPLVVLRASDQEHLQTAVKAAEALGFRAQLAAYVEDGELSDRRAVDARLAEAVVRLQLSLEEPFLSEWMADGLASLISERTTGRALIDGELRTLRSVQSEVVRGTGGGDSWRVDLYEVSGVRLEGKPNPQQAEGLAIVAYLDKHSPASFTRIVAELGRRGPTEGRPKYREEERSLERHLGKTALDDLSRALREGRSFRP